MAKCRGKRLFDKLRQLVADRNEVAGQRLGGADWELQAQYADWREWVRVVGGFAAEMRSRREMFTVVAHEIRVFCPARVLNSLVTI